MALPAMHASRCHEPPQSGSGAASIGRTVMAPESLRISGIRDSCEVGNVY
jgi:hypothetical protein